MDAQNEIKRTLKQDDAIEAIQQLLVLNNHRLKPVGLCCGLKVRIRVG